MFSWIELLRKIWDLIKKIFLKIINFTINIYKFFRDPNRIKKLKENNNFIAATIKENLDNGNYRVVNCLFNKDTNEVVDMEADTIGIEAESIDEETKNKFKDKDMIILK